MRASILIPLGFVVLNTKEIIREGDMYLSQGMEWKLFVHNIGQPLKAMPEGCPAIRPLETVEGEESQKGVKVPVTAKATQLDASTCASPSILEEKDPVVIAIGAVSYKSFRNGYRLGCFQQTGQQPSEELLQKAWDTSFSKSAWDSSSNHNLTELHQERLAIKLWQDWKRLSDEADLTLSHQDGMDAQSAWNKLDSFMTTFKEY